MNDLFLTISPAVIAAIVTYFTVIKNIFSPLKIKVANEQLYKVYLPLFTFIEPYLYKEVSIEILIQFLNIFKDIKTNHYELIDSDLLNDIQILEKSIINNKYCHTSYDSVCRTLDRLFEGTRRYLKLPTRKLTYKINNNQFNKSVKEISNIIKCWLIESLPLLFLIIFFSIIYSLIIWLLSLLSKI